MQRPIRRVRARPKAGAPISHRKRERRIRVVDLGHRRPIRARVADHVLHYHVVQDELALIDDQIQGVWDGVVQACVRVQDNLVRFIVGLGEETARDVNGGGVGAGVSDGDVELAANWAGGTEDPYASA